MSLAVYAGSFDPITNGHMDIVRRTLTVFDNVIVAVAINDAKVPLFTTEERVELLQKVFKDEPRVTVQSFTGLLVDFARQVGARILVRGLRAVSDFEYEFQMAQMNQKLYPEVETLFLMTGQQYFYVSSRTVKEVARFGGNVHDLVPGPVSDLLAMKFGGLR